MVGTAELVEWSDVDHGVASLKLRRSLPRTNMAMDYYI